MVIANLYIGTLFFLNIYCNFIYIVPVRQVLQQTSDKTWGQGSFGPAELTKTPQDFTVSDVEHKLNSHLSHSHLGLAWP